MLTLLANFNIERVIMIFFKYILFFSMRKLISFSFY